MMGMDILARFEGETPEAFKKQKDRIYIYNHTCRTGSPFYVNGQYGVCVCSAFHYQSEDIAGMWGHFGWSPECQTAV